MREQYFNLLKKYCGRNDLHDLINEAILELERQRDVTYLATGKYPDRRCVGAKIKHDLQTMKKEVEIQKLQEEYGGK